MFDSLDRMLSSKAPEFPKDGTWLNALDPISLEKLKGHVVVLDFWTYCCLNCIHMIPTLSKLEDEFKDEPVVFIGVHSAKFEEEQKHENIEEAINRYDIRHPVIADDGMKIWRAYGANAWPTIIIIDPKGAVAYKRSGEQTRASLGSVIEMVLDKAKGAGTLTKSRVKIRIPEHKDKSVLLYPAKMSFSQDGKDFALSDSNHNRILIVDAKTGKIKKTIGSGKAGLTDGSFSTSAFQKPQGVLWLGQKVYVADTENHALREIDLNAEKVKTVAGTGEQGWFYPFEYSGSGTDTRINSPWDLTFADNKIFIAMAGFHQIWAYEPKSGFVFPFAGAGFENISDGSLPDAQFAQPSGIWADNGYLYVADSEVSGVRSIDLKKRYVSTLVGSGLFVFGHKDGSLTDAKLQHPLGISANDGKIYVADTYNSSIRTIDITAEKISTLIGTPAMKSFCRFDDPNCDTLGLYEPSDVKVNGNLVYIVDTNNHLVRTFDTKEMMLKTLDVKP